MGKPSLHHLHVSAVSISAQGCPSWQCVHHFVHHAAAAEPTCMSTCIQP